MRNKEIIKKVITMILMVLFVGIILVFAGINPILIIIILLGLTGILIYSSNKYKTIKEYEKSSEEFREKNKLEIETFTQVMIEIKKVIFILILIYIATNINNLVIAIVFWILAILILGNLIIQIIKIDKKIKEIISKNNK